MKTYLLAAVALFSLASVPSFAASEGYPAPITRPITSVVPSGADVGSNGAPVRTGITAQVNNANVVLNNSSEAEADSSASFPSQTNNRPGYAMAQMRTTAGR